MQALESIRFYLLRYLKSTYMRGNRVAFDGIQAEGDLQETLPTRKC